MTLRITTSDRHIPALDGLRGVAALIVMLYHFFTNRVPWGWMGVDLFFVLSGFLITGILLRTKDSPGYYRNYFARRSLRIFPLYFLFLVIFFLIFPLIGVSDGIGDYPYLEGIQSWYWLYAQNWLVFFDPVYPGHEMITHFWSLAIEEQFYVFWPLAIYLLPNRRILSFCIGLIALSISVRLIMFYGFDMSYLKVYVFTFSRLDALAVGSALAVMVRNSDHKEWLNRRTPSILIASTIGILVTFVLFKSMDFEAFTTYGYTVLAIFFGSLLVMALSSDPRSLVRRILETKPLTMFGKYSYGIYVYHIPVLRLGSRALSPYIESRAVTLIICFIMSLVVAYASYHLIEKRFLNLKKYFETKRVPTVKEKVEETAETIV